ncbi:ribonuclease R [Taibaiella lutea]|uniref:Ribonuclease R n=1 Tax=Taibaiella lutea TaxID=2608001 RepID=A0A5M6CIJ5_9BACT|nr:ribonuclease R [Taibaiella lutea]KAA5534833.1 ribonuclease R [Taibaiella lutea]
MAHKNKKKKQSVPKKQRAKSPLSGKDAVGILDVSKGGLGFVKVEGWEQDLLVRPENMGTAFHGDKVKVIVENVNTKGRPEGSIKEVIERRQIEFTGKLEVTEKFAFLIPDKENMRVDIFVPPHKLKGGKTGDHAIVKIVEWPIKSKNPVGEVVELLTNQRVNEIAMKSILVEAGFPLHFSDDAMEEAARIPDILDSEEIKKRKDCRDVFTITIDPADAKDFDDAISIRPLKSGYYEVGVHIADVSYYVQPDTELDKEAYERATSVYLPDRVLPMLPEHISNVLCSLRPNEDKFTFSAIFQMNEAGDVKQYWIGRTVIHSNRRYAYEEAQQIIETGKGDYAKEILLLHKISQNLRAERFKKGAINFSSQEVRFKLDAEGIPVGIEIKESKEANQLIEELMLLANKTVAGFVQKKKVNKVDIPFPYRVHDAPNEDKLAVFAAFASRFGYKFNLNDPDKIAESFNQMLAAVQGKPEQHVLEQLGIRTMAKAIYTTDNIGHYGLGFESYCHFTSPIRRYPDVMVHRIVQQCIDDKVKIDKKMEAKCRHCSDQERKAMEAERGANKYKQVEYMQKFVGDVFDAVISGVSSFGFWAETVEHKCEGLVGLAELSLALKDEFTFLENDYALVGMHTGKRFRIGDKVKIQVLAANLEKRQIDFGYAAEDGKTQEKPASKVPKKPKSEGGKGPKRKKE